MNRVIAIIASLLSLASTSRELRGQTPLGTEFVYQGQLKASGQPVVGSADYQFSLFDSPEAGGQIGATVVKSNVAFVNGVFTTSLDFGAAAFNGNARWLQVAVRSPAGSGSFTTLTPRQPLSATPYALRTRGIDGHSLDAADSTPVDAVFVDNAGRVGIGTNQPSSNLEVSGPTPSIFIQDTAGAPTGFVLFEDSNGDATGYVGFDSNLNPHFSVVNIRQGGNIVLNPGGGGVVQVPVLEITGADVAEKFPVSEKLSPGLLAAIDSNNPGKLCLSRGAYNKRVAGVVSGANNFSVGAVLGSTPECRDAPPIALSGRVYVHCDARGAAIEPGDFLTTSELPGYAMKVIDASRAQGAIIGKAMTSLARGRQGMVLVLVSLQ